MWIFFGTLWSSSQQRAGDAPKLALSKGVPGGPAPQPRNFSSESGGRGPRKSRRDTNACAGKVEKKRNEATASRGPTTPSKTGKGHDSGQRMLDTGESEFADGSDTLASPGEEIVAKTSGVSIKREATDNKETWVKKRVKPKKIGSYKSCIGVQQSTGERKVFGTSKKASGSWNLKEVAGDSNKATLPHRVAKGKNIPRENSGMSQRAPSKEGMEEIQIEYEKSRKWGVEEIPSMNCVQGGFVEWKGRDGKKRDPASFSWWGETGE